MSFKRINTLDTYTAEFKRLVHLLGTAKKRTRKEADKFITNLSKLIYVCKMYGKMYIFYSEELEYQKQEKVVYDVPLFPGVFPDFTTKSKNVLTKKTEDLFYRISKQQCYRDKNRE